MMYVEQNNLITTNLILARDEIKEIIHQLVQDIDSNNIGSFRQKIKNITAEDVLLARYNYNSLLNIAKLRNNNEIFSILAETVNSDKTQVSSFLFQTIGSYGAFDNTEFDVLAKNIEKDEFLLLKNEQGESLVEHAISTQNIRAALKIADKISMSLEDKIQMLKEISNPIKLKPGVDPQQIDCTTDILIRYAIKCDDEHKLDGQKLIKPQNISHENNLDVANHQTNNAGASSDLLGLDQKFDTNT